MYGERYFYSADYDECQESEIYVLYARGRGSGGEYERIVGYYDTVQSLLSDCPEAMPY